MEAEFFFERFVSLADKHVIAARVRILPYHRNVKVKIISGINGRMTNSGTQHFHEVETRMHKGIPYGDRGIEDPCAAVLRTPFCLNRQSHPSKENPTDRPAVRSNHDGGGSACGRELCCG